MKVLQNYAVTMPRNRRTGFKKIYGEMNLAIKAKTKHVSHTDWDHQRRHLVILKVKKYKEK